MSMLIGPNAKMKMSRIWSMPNAETFKVPQIGDWVRWYLKDSKCSIDPFARNSRLATHTNDLNPETAADFHLDAGHFLRMLQDRGVQADLLLFHPPYSPRQLKECYDGIGRKMQMEDGQTARLRKEWRDLAMPLLTPDAVVLSFGWNTVGFGTGLAFYIEEIMLICHGADHNDTICMAERRLPISQEVLQLA